MKGSDKSSKRSAWRLVIIALVPVVLLMPLFLIHDEPGKALRKAAFVGDVEAVRKILKNHPEVINSFQSNPNTAGNTTTGKTVFGQWVANVRFFFQSQFDAWEDAEFSALDYAVRGDHPDVVSVLLDHKADVTHLNEMNYAAIHQAIQHGNMDVVKQFVDHKVDLELKDRNGGTPLSWAVLCEQREITELLIAHGVKINAGNLPPLHWAVEVHSKPLADLLIKHGADINLSDSYQRTPLSMALTNGDTNMAAFLKDHGAK